MSMPGQPLPEGISPGERMESGRVPGQVGVQKAMALNITVPSGMILFSLGPVYVYAGVGRDLIAHFQSETEPFECVNFMFDQPLFLGLNEWNYFLQAMPYEIFKVFREYMQGLTLIDSVRKRYFEIRMQYCWINVCHMTEFDPSNEIAIFLPSGNNHQCNLYSTPAARFGMIRTDAAEPGVVKRSAKFFSI